MATFTTIPVTPGTGLLLDAISLTIGGNTVVRETMVIADPNNGSNLASVGSDGALKVDGSGATQPITGTVVANQGSSPWVTSITGSVAVTGTFFQSTQPVSIASTVSIQGTLTNNAAAPSTHNIGALTAIANASAPTYTEGDQVLLSTDLSGAVRVNISGSVVASNDITQWNSVALGSPSAYGTGPGAVNVIGVNAFVTSIPNVTNAGVFAVQDQHVSAATAGFEKITDGTNVAAVKAASTAAVDTDPALVVTEPGSTTASACANTSVTSTSSSILSANTARREAIIVNTGVVTVYIGLGQTPSGTAYHVVLRPCAVAHDGSGGSFVTDTWKGQINAITASTSSNVSVTELT